MAGHHVSKQLKQCKALTKDGIRCKNNSSSPMCYRHTKSKSKSKSPSSTKQFCKNALKQKISINIREKRWSSPKQAIAVSYSQVKKWYPRCKKYFER